MRIVVIGTGYVGLVSASCFAEMGHHVICVDTNAERIAQLRQGHIPIHEPGLDAMVRNNHQQSRLHFTTELRPALANVDVCFIAVGTPSSADGAADTRQVFMVAEDLGRYLPAACVVVNKSTVPVGTAERVERAIGEQLQQRQVSFTVSVASNPEFLREGCAIEDFMRPDRIIIGTADTRSTQVLQTLYAPFLRKNPRLLVMGRREAEMSKYAANAMLATRISFMNEMACLSESLGVDIESVRLGIGSDSRIGYDFLYAGCGYGGSCFPKDVRALIHTAQRHGLPSHILQAVEERNTIQKAGLFVKLKQHLGTLEGRRIALWGLAFKPGTDDIREAPALQLLESLIQAGAQVHAYDPVACDNVAHTVPTQWIDSAQLTLYASDPYQALEGAQALVVATEWKPFRQPDWKRIATLLQTPLVIDGRNIYDPQTMRENGFTHVGIGRGMQSTGYAALSRAA
ncbi:UDP-glucose/GDP-mannose dehydrogenase family protein [Lampropedia puyangensis]|uniref:UDP-glucose 6-dehydrogenase n=1 Tax=Lampropedia puyangensis TaxID=1330072 RepID=A0A4S8EVP2_9BURK|nr:UDP-glucose/GDP-mannose dehydrogenase family protein [Lampropedia puyangensis]THT96461.1 UDP-glucose/GDP-mannose dehydrogenase family protein [Lampropedia puyangensis]